MGLKYIAANSVTVLDPATGLLYPTARYPVPAQGSSPSRICACQGLAGVRLGMDGFDPGVPKEFWTLLPLPATSRVSVKIASFPVIANVPVS